jgi:5-methylcytosine-specific restriction endonuclease McrA
MPPHRSSIGEEWWFKKIRKLAARSFGDNVAGWAIHLLGALCSRPTGCIDSEELRALGIPHKYINRALAALTRSGIVRADFTPCIRVELLRNRLARHKNRAQKLRGRISQSDREALLEADDHRCGHCGHKFADSGLQIDHIVPICFLGADEPGNWVALCTKCNRKKWDVFDRGYLLWYRGQRVSGTVGLRIKDGYFRPHINGRTRTDTR